MTIEDYSYLQGGEGEEGEGEEQYGGGMFSRTTPAGLLKKKENEAAQKFNNENPVNIPGRGRKFASATIVSARDLAKSASALTKSGVSGASSFAQSAAAKAAATAALAASAPSKLASTAHAAYSPPKSDNDLIKERKFIAINFNESATSFETEFKSELSDLVVKFFTVSAYTRDFEFSKIKVLKKLSSIKLYHTKLCLKQIFAELKTCNAYLFQLPLPDQSTRDAAIKQFKDKIQSVVEANFKDNFFNDNIAIYISNNYLLPLQENLDNYLFIDTNSNDYSITNLHQKSILLYILQLFVIYYYPKYLLEIICKVMEENVTAISEGIDALMNDGNLNIKLSELVASLVSNYEKANALRTGGQRGVVGGTNPGEALIALHPGLPDDIVTNADKRKAEQLSNEQIKKLVFNKYIKGADLQDEYNKKSRKVFYNALVNFAISIILDITRNNYTSEIITKLVEFSNTRLILNEKDINDDIALIQRDIDTLNTNISAQEQKVNGPPGIRLKRDALFDKYYAASGDEKDSIERKILNTTSVAYPIYVEFQILERFRAELEIMEKKKNTYKRINEVKRKMFKIDNILEIKDDIWLGRGTPGDNYHDALYNLITTAAEQSSMFSLNQSEVALNPLSPLRALTPEPTPGPRYGPWPATSDGLQPAAFSGPTVDRTSLDPRVASQLNKTDNLLRKTVDEAYINNLLGRIREYEDDLIKAETDSSIDADQVRVDLLNAKQELDDANAAALSPPLAAAPPIAAPLAPVPVPVPVPAPPPAAANAGPADAHESVFGQILSIFDDKSPDAIAAKAKAAYDARMARAREAERLKRNREAAERERVRKADEARQLAATSGDAVLTSDDAVLTAGGKRRTRRHKKRAGTRKYKKRAGTRRHKKRSGTHKKRKNRTR